MTNDMWFICFRKKGKVSAGYCNHCMDCEQYEISPKPIKRFENNINMKLQLGLGYEKNYN